MARSCVPALSGPFYLLLLLFLLTAGVTSASDEDADAKPRTAYACENEALTLECEEGRVIRIQRANYGRFAIDVCNKYGETEGWSVQCFSPKSKDTISERCDGRAQCLMKVNNDVFGDPCHLTPKYAEVKYVCQPVLSRMSESTTTDRPTPAPMQKKIPRGGSPQPPRITSAVAISPTEVEVLWTQAEPTNPVLTTAIYFTDHGMRLGPSPFYSSNSGSAVIKDLRPDSSYDIFLKSFNAQGPSVSSNVVTVRTPPQRQLSTPGTITASTSGTLPLSAYIRVSSSKSDHGSQDPGAVPTDQGDTDTGILTPELLSEMEEAENGTEARLGASRSAGRNSHAADAYADDNADGTAALIGSQPPENSENLPNNEHPLESGIHFDEEKRELTFDLDLSNSNEKNIFMGFLNHLLKSGQDEKSEYGEGGAHEDIGSKLDVESGTVVEGSDIEPRVAKDESGSNVTNPVTENQSGSDVTDPVPEIESGGTDVINKYTEAKLGEPSDLKLEMSPDGTLTTDLLPRRDDDGLAGSGVGDSEDEENDGESEDRRTGVVVSDCKSVGTRINLKNHIG
ncbi:uncharacterized protein LOC101864702 [Aplysia californica]|uniref:Uncharacterized protein LOC101864702 n=1 Tax=Aplysia californica TaxID=6500 RepID=A0ABM1A674_APLCA|nr:uncharacterized protein LOC101864702 [Aplysia californica]